MMKATILFLFLGMVLEGAASTPSRDNLDLAANRRARAANNQAASKDAVCGYKDRQKLKYDKSQTLNFDRVYDEVNSNSGTALEKKGIFTAGVAGVYFVTLKSTLELGHGENLFGVLKLSSGNYKDDGNFIYSKFNTRGWIREQASASRYVSMSAGETLHISLMCERGYVTVINTIMCVSLYSASG